MSRLIRSRWGLHGLFVLVIVVAAGVVVTTPHLVRGQDAGAPRNPQTPESKVDERLVAEVQALRADIGLTNADLATLGLTESQSEAVMQQLLNWTEANANRLVSAERAEQQAVAELKEAQRLINVGPRDERLLRTLPDKSDAIQRARQDRRSIQEEAARRALAVTSRQQQDLWALVYARTDRGQRRPSQYEIELVADYRAARNQRVVSSEPTDGPHVDDPQLAGFKQERSTRMSGVQAAESRVLPSPITEAQLLGLPFEADLEGDALPGR